MSAAFKLFLRIYTKRKTLAESASLSRFFTTHERARFAAENFRYAIEAFPGALPPKYCASACPVYDFLLRATCSGVPCATTLPPSSPPSGPRSRIQSALRITSRLCSMMMMRIAQVRQPMQHIQQLASHHRSAIQSSARQAGKESCRSAACSIHAPA